MAGWMIWNSPLFNESAKNLASYEQVANWARSAGMIEYKALRKRSVQSVFPRRWVREEQVYGFRISYGRTRVRRQVDKLAISLGMTARKGESTSKSFKITLLLPDGREGLVLTFVPKIFVAIIIDDIGYNLAKTKRIAALPARITGSIIPLTPWARDSAKILARNGKEVFLHIPMQSSAKQMRDVPEYSMAIRLETTPEQAADYIEKSINSVPYLAGVNNHEGSIATENRALMDAIMPPIKRHNLVFIDSWTSAKSLAGKAAKSAGLRWGKRAIFLDIPAGKEEAVKAFGKMMAIARRKGEVIAIGHPHDATLEVLEEEIPVALAEGIVFVGASQLARYR